MFREMTALAGVTVLAALGSTAAAAAAGTSASTAAGACWQEGGKWWCENLVGAPLHASGSGEVVDHLRTNPSVFVCREEAGATGGGGPHPNRWVWTQGDDHGNWGWVKDSDIASETDSLPEC